MNAGFYSMLAFWMGGAGSPPAAAPSGYFFWQLVDSPTTIYGGQIGGT